MGFRSKILLSSLKVSIVKFSKKLRRCLRIWTSRSFRTRMWRAGIRMGVWPVLGLHINRHRTCWWAFRRTRTWLGRWARKGW